MDINLPKHKGISLFQRFYRKLIRDTGRDIREYPSKVKDPKIAFVYLKLIKIKELYYHTNTLEIICIIETLNILGYDVVLVDRGCSKIPKRYLNKSVDLYIGQNGFGGGRHCFNHLKDIAAKKNIIIFTQQPPLLQQKRTKRRNKRRAELLSTNFECTRNVCAKEAIIFEKEINSFDLIMVPETEDLEFRNELKRLNVEIKKLNWSTLSRVLPIERSANCPDDFILMAGGEPIRKGIDFAIEIFKDLPYKLHILTPDVSRVDEIISAYNNPSNIINHGFIDLGSGDFEKIARNCKYCLNFAYSEGLATSQLHCMKTGLIPIIDKDAGKISFNKGLEINLEKNDIAQVRKSIKDYLNGMNWDTYKIISEQTTDFIYDNYTIETFRHDILKALR